MAWEMMVLSAWQTASGPSLLPFEERKRKGKNDTGKNPSAWMFRKWFLWIYRGPRNKIYPSTCSVVDCLLYLYKYIQATQSDISFYLTSSSLFVTFLYKYIQAQGIGKIVFWNDQSKIKFRYIHIINENDIKYEKSNISFKIIFYHNI